MTKRSFKLEIFGFSGNLGSGKNYVSEQLFLPLLPKKNTLVMALADHFKVACCAQDGVPYDKVFVTKDDQTRQLLQRRGTELGRDKYGHDIWIRVLETWIKVYQERGIERFIITDLRFENEVEWVKSLGGITFRVKAPERNITRLKQEAGDNDEKLKIISQHPSEIALNEYQGFDYIINNDYQDRPQVANHVRNIIRELIYEEPVNLTIFCDLDDTICQCRKFYQDIIEVVVDLIQEKTQIPDHDLQPIIQRHIMSFEHRYYTREDFATSLVKVAMEAFIHQDQVMEFESQLRDQIYALGLDVYNQSYNPLHEDSLDRVRELRKYGQVIIFTLGDHTEQMKKIVNLGLLDFPTEIFTHKDENMFRYLQNKYPFLSLCDDWRLISSGYRTSLSSWNSDSGSHLINPPFTRN